MKAFVFGSIALLLGSGPVLAADLVDPGPPPPGAYNDQPPYQPQPAYQPVPGPQAYAAPVPQGCMVLPQIEDRLASGGWRNFRPDNVDPARAVLFATQGDGLVYRLVIDRCSGNLLDAHLIQPRPAYGYAAPAGGPVGGAYAPPPAAYPASGYAPAPYWRQPPRFY